MSAISRNLFDVTEKFSGVCPILGKNNISSAERFYSLHWLPIHLCINFKLHALLTYKTLTLCQTYYLPSLLSPYFTSRSLRSSDQNLLHQPRVRTVIGSRAFISSAPKIWNYLPSPISASSSVHAHFQAST